VHEAQMAPAAAVHRRRSHAHHKGRLHGVQVAPEVRVSGDGSLGVLRGLLGNHRGRGRRGGGVAGGASEAGGAPAGRGAGQALQRRRSGGE